MSLFAASAGVRRLLVSPTIPFLRRLSSSPSAATPAAVVATDFAVSYLVSTCGLSPEVAARAAAAGYLRFVSPERPDSVLRLLRSHGFTDGHITRLISHNPRLLAYSDVDGKIKPKLEFFALLGLSPSQICSFPILLAFSLEGRLRPSLNSLATALGSAEIATKTICRWPRILCYSFQEKVLPNLEALRQFGLPTESIHMAAKKYPQALTCPPDELVKQLSWLQEKGLDPRSKIFGYALVIRSGLKKSTWERKFRAFHDMGWTDEEIVQAFRKFPFMIALSEAKVKKMASYYEEEFGWGKDTLLALPGLLALSLEKTVRPRRLLLEYLRLVGKLKRKLIPDDVRSTKRVFLNKYFYRYCDQYPVILEVYKVNGGDGELSTKSDGTAKKE